MTPDANVQEPAKPASAGAPDAYATLLPGDRLPRFAGRTRLRDSILPDAMAGKYLVFCSFMSRADALGRSAVAAIVREHRRFDDKTASLFGVAADPADYADLHDRIPGIRFLRDEERAVSRILGVLPKERGAPGDDEPARRSWLVVDPTLHVLAVIPFRDEDPEHRAVFQLLDRLPPPERYGGGDIPPPVLVLPNVLEPALCRRLISLYDADGGAESGIVRDDKMISDGAFKRRRDYNIQDAGLVSTLKRRIGRRVSPEIKRLFFMDLVGVERHIVGCYRAEDGGHFRPHRDNDPGLTEHRRYAVSINLNDDFGGGEVCFPEYRAKGIKAPAGWAVVFPCAILHAVNPVTSGSRYAYLPFVYDEAGRALRDANREKLEAALQAVSRPA